MNKNQQAYISHFRSPWKVKSFFFSKLPSLWFWNCKITHLDMEKCCATVKPGWRTNNPFKSIYFATQAGVAEISTGVPVQLAMAGKGNFAMYVIAFRAEFIKVAKSRTTFTCTDGRKIEKLIDSLIEKGSTGTVDVISEGINEEGEVVSRFYLTWSFKKK